MRVVGLTGRVRVLEGKFWKPPTQKISLSVEKKQDREEGVSLTRAIWGRDDGRNKLSKLWKSRIAIATETGEQPLS